MKLKNLKIENFKGIKKEEINFNGENVSIFGDNESGKTTVADSIYWLLFDKDSLNSSKFDIKPLDKNGEVVHGLEPTVEAVFDNVKLKKSFSENWTKKRGDSKKVFTGHTTSYYIDDVPVKQKDYQSAINEICDESNFKLITNPKYFNEEMNWKDRRNLLLQVCGNITDNEVISSNSKLKSLKNIISGRSLDDHKKVLDSKRKDINKELDKIPVRIDEASKSIQEVVPIEQVESKLDALNKEHHDITEKIKLIESGGEINLLKNQLIKIENDIALIEQDVSKKERLFNNSKNERADIIYKEINTEEYQIEMLSGHIKNYENDISEKQKQIDELRKDWHLENNRVFVIENIDTVCPVCKQDIPSGQIEDAKRSALEKFNNEKADNLKRITEKGQSLSDEIKNIKETIKTHKEDIYKINDKVGHLKDKLVEIENEKIDVKLPKNFDRLISKKEELINLIAKNDCNSIETSPLYQRKCEIESSIQILNEEALKIKNNKALEERITELKGEEKKLAIEYENIESELFLIEEFVRTKVEMLDKKINSMFKLAKFKLFEIQVNGDLNECCEVMVNGVPYRSLNNAMRINVGLDICETISKHFGVELPIIIDNAESVTELYKTSSQQIRLVVTPGQKTLKVERG